MPQPVIWALIDDRAGNTAQTLGVAEALGLPFEYKTVTYSGAARLPNLMRGAGLWGVSRESRQGLKQGPWPDLVIAAGRRTAPVARWIKCQAAHRGQTVALCQIMDPGWPGRDDFALIAVPRHDRHMPAGGQVFPVSAVPHRVTLARLDEARPSWAAQFAALPGPRIAVLVGGATKAMPFSVQRAAALGRSVATLAAVLGGAVMVTTSRRTGREAEAALTSALPETAWVYRWGDAGENPYFGMLAWANVVVVTGDSMSMVSEACGTDKPVLIDAPSDETSAKHARLHDVLVQQGRALRLSGDGEAMAQAVSGLDLTPLNSAVDIAATLRARGVIATSE